MDESDFSQSISDRMAICFTFFINEQIQYFSFGASSSFTLHLAPQFTLLTSRPTENSENRCRLSNGYLLVSDISIQSMMSSYAQFNWSLFDKPLQKAGELTKKSPKS